jgi:uncharacterized protein
VSTPGRTAQTCGVRRDRHSLGFLAVFAATSCLGGCGGQGHSSAVPGPGGTVAPLPDPISHGPFSLGHAAGLEELRASDLDWAYIAPAGDFDHAGARTGRYKIADHGDMSSRISYADFAIVLLDEVDAPRHRRAAVSVRER